MHKIYKNKKVLITGHTGFKGSWLTIWLLHIGAEVIGYALDPKTEKDNFVLAGLCKKVKDYRYDIRDKEKLFKVIYDEKPEIIFHLAAQPLVLDSYNDPLYTIETNTLGTVNVLEAFRKSDTAELLIIITTDKVYENKEWIWGYRENDRLGGNDPYSASKSAAEILVNSYLQSFFNPEKKSRKKVVTVRAGNVIGGGDWSENRIIPDCIKAIEKNEKIRIRNPNSIRPWQYVLEPLNGYLLLGEKLLKGDNNVGAWNFGPLSKNTINVEKLVRISIDKYGKGSYIINKNKQALHESNYLSLDISKAINKLNWKPMLNLDETISFTIDWYKNYKNSDIYSFCINQIKNYMELWKLRNTN